MSIDFYDRIIHIGRNRFDILELMLQCTKIHIYPRVQLRGFLVYTLLQDCMGLSEIAKYCMKLDKISLIIGNSL